MLPTPPRLSAQSAYHLPDQLRKCHKMPSGKCKNTTILNFYFIIPKLFCSVLFLAVYNKMSTLILPEH